jgi:hypothetical protein
MYNFWDKLTRNNDNSFSLKSGEVCLKNWSNESKFLLEIVKPSYTLCIYWNKIKTHPKLLQKDNLLSNVKYIIYISILVVIKNKLIIYYIKNRNSKRFFEEKGVSLFCQNYQSIQPLSPCSFSAKMLFTKIRLKNRWKMIEIKCMVVRWI